VKKVAEYAPNVPGAIIARQVLTPLDLERTYGLTEGNIFHGDLTLEQLFSIGRSPDGRSIGRLSAGFIFVARGRTPAEALRERRDTTRRTRLLRDLKKGKFREAVA